MNPPGKSIVARFFRLPGGREPVRDWLGEQSPEDKRRIGGDLMKVEFGWPCGPPLCRSLSGYPGLYEVRSRLITRRIARVFFTVSEQNMVLLHGFIKKSQATPLRELKLAERRAKEYHRSV
ncbi:MAG: type II toxin-antitoxin system RelE/ParE family toxin [Spirochaetaceae bacterium]|nr:type II toxin-antitoxin system RelE/ParE family toxin [Spirochaetaceae bacterium]